MLSQLTQSTGLWSGDREIFSMPLPIFKDWKKKKKKTSRFFITREYLFYCSPRFTGNTLGVFNHPTRLFRFQILFLVISRIPQISVHFPLVSTIGEACFPEVRVFVTFHFSKCRCYSWGFALFSTLNLQKSMFVCYLRKQSFPQENSITDTFNSINHWPGDLTKIICEFHLIIILEWPMFKFPWAPPFTTQKTKLWSLSVVWMMPDWTILCSLFVKSRSIRVFEYSVILVSSFMSCFMSFPMANDSGNLLAERFPSWSMSESSISTEPFFSRSFFAKESLRESIKLAFFTFRGLYEAAIKSSLHFGLLISIHNNSFYLLLSHS